MIDGRRGPILELKDAIFDKDNIYYLKKGPYKPYHIPCLIALLLTFSFISVFIGYLAWTNYKRHEIVR